MISISKMYIHPLHLSGVSSYALSGIAGALGTENVTLVRGSDLCHLAVIVTNHIPVKRWGCIYMYMRVENRE